MGCGSALPLRALSIAQFHWVSMLTVATNVMSSAKNIYPDIYIILALIAGKHLQAMKAFPGNAIDRGLRPIWLAETVTTTA